MVYVYVPAIWDAFLRIFRFAIGWFSSHAKAPNIHILGVFEQIMVKGTQFEQNNNYYYL